MGIDFTAVEEVFAGIDWGDDLTTLKQFHGELRARAKDACPMNNEAGWGDDDRIRLHADACRQTYLYRAIYLFEGSLQAAVACNPFMMGLGIRGFLENTAALGYLHYRLASLLAGNLDPEIVDRDTFALLMGSKEKSIRKEHFAVDPKNVLTMLEYADKSIDKGILGKKTGVLSDCYAYLCEFAHPNFHSNSLAFDLEKEQGALMFRYGKPLPADVAKLVKYLDLGAGFHLYLHDGIDGLLPPSRSPSGSA